MSEQQWNFGDVVRLKSGGPEMVVGFTYKDGEDEQACTCHWFSGTEARCADFKSIMLTVPDREGFNKFMASLGDDQTDATFDARGWTHLVEESSNE